MFKDKWLLEHDRFHVSPISAASKEKLTLMVGEYPQQRHLVMGVGKQAIEWLEAFKFT